MSDVRLVIGLPAGSLADPNRGGNLINLLKHAGFATKGYDQGGPSSFPITTVLMGWDGRPQEFGAQLAIGEVDIAIAGDDWIRERTLEFKFEYDQDIKLERVLSLERGHVRIVVIRRPVPEQQDVDAWFRALFSEKTLVTVVSEMPYVALEWIQAKAQQLGFAASHAAYAVQKYKTPPRIGSGVVIYETWGKTEAKVTNGSVDFGFEITQSGSAIRNYGLNICAEVMKSETAIWANPAIKSFPEKYDLARMFLLNLYGSVFAENKVLLSFNARNDAVPALLEYLKEHKLFGDEPTMNAGPNFTEFGVQLEATCKELPLARVRYELLKLGATHLETIPLDSSIPGIDALAF